ncbi:hypothetical protein P280DRAFT_376100, partial [Massarina eburnea CBS 473.64]
YLTIEEESHILEQFLGTRWKPNNQILWSGVDHDLVQKWADDHGKQTLKTAMGPLMDPKSPNCLRLGKAAIDWSKYMSGASALFAWQISQGERVTVLLPPPPQKLNPNGLSQFQTVEEPVISLAISRGAILRVETVHPTVTGAEEAHYETYPVDKTSSW